MPNPIALELSAHIEATENQITALTTQRDQLVTLYRFAAAGVCPFCVEARPGGLPRVGAPPVLFCFHGLTFQVQGQPVPEHQVKG